jgi:hypothetical protein
VLTEAACDTGAPKFAGRTTQSMGNHAFLCHLVAGATVGG